MKFSNKTILISLLISMFALFLYSCDELKKSTSEEEKIPTSNATTEDATPSNSATYRITFTSTWSATTHSTDFPNSPHYSRLIIAKHNSDVSFWEPGETASDGIESMAETGGVTTLESEIKTAFDAGDSEQAIIGSNLSTSPASTSTEITVSKNFSLLTIVTMLAPSPDWFVGVHDLNLIENGAFIENKTITLFPYDAGTDNGITYTSSNNDTNPAEIIKRINEAPFSKDVEVGTLTIEKL